MQNNTIHNGSASDGSEQSSNLTAPPAGRLGRRSFMKRIGLGGAALLPAGGLLSARNVARASGMHGGLAAGDAAILRFLAAIEILESDLWQQYNELALGNESYQLALNVLDG